MFYLSIIRLFVHAHFQTFLTFRFKWLKPLLSCYSIWFCFEFIECEIDPVFWSQFEYFHSLSWPNQSFIVFFELAFALVRFIWDRFRTEKHGIQWIFLFFSRTNHNVSLCHLKHVQHWETSIQRPFMLLCGIVIEMRPILNLAGNWDWSACFNRQKSWELRGIVSFVYEINIGLFLIHLT
jgi:hypothetical protein